MGVTEVFSMEDPNLSFEWAEIHVYRHPAYPRKYAVDSSSGCSCDYYEPPTENQLRGYTPLTKTEARTEVAEWARNRYDAQPDSATKAIEAFNNAVK